MNGWIFLGLSFGYTGVCRWRESCSPPPLVSMRLVTLRPSIQWAETSWVMGSGGVSQRRRRRRQHFNNNAIDTTAANHILACIYVRHDVMTMRSGGGRHDLDDQPHPSLPGRVAEALLQKVGRDEKLRRLRKRRQDGVGGR